MKTPFQTRTIKEAIESLIDYRGKTPPKTTSGVWLVTAKVIKEGFIQNENKEYIAADFYDEWMRRGLPKQWDVLVTTEAPLGEVAQIRTPEKIALAQRVILLRGNPDVVHQGFLYQAMKCPFVQGELKARSSGTTVLGIKQSELWKVKIPWYPLPTQRKIAGILSAYDDLIENNTRRIDILEAMGQAIYRAWFVEFRFPGHEQVKLVNSPLGKIPERWEVSTLGSVASFENGDRGKNYPNASEFVSEGVPFINAGHLVDGSVDLQNVNRITEETFDRLGRGKLQSGDLLYCVRGSLGRIARVGTLDRGAIASSLVIVRECGLANACYLYYKLEGSNGQKLAAELNNGVAQPNISVESLKRYPILAPPRSILELFNELIEPIWSLIHVNRNRSSNLRKTRDLLLPKLISGQLEVENLDIETCEAVTE
jgi:type I restriction enzyme, S subunit